jgi:hypothetical protein
MVIFQPFIRLIQRLTCAEIIEVQLPVAVKNKPLWFAGDDVIRLGSVSKGGLIL